MPFWGIKRSIGPISAAPARGALPWGPQPPVRLPQTGRGPGFGDTPNRVWRDGVLGRGLADSAWHGAGFLGRVGGGGGSRPGNAPAIRRGLLGQVGGGAQSAAFVGSSRHFFNQRWTARNDGALPWRAASTRTTCDAVRWGACS